MRRVILKSVKFYAESYLKFEFVSNRLAAKFHTFSPRNVIFQSQPRYIQSSCIFLKLERTE